jgi:hypothetical protein
VFWWPAALQNRAKRVLRRPIGRLQAVSGLQNSAEGLQNHAARVHW